MKPGIMNQAIKNLKMFGMFVGGRFFTEGNTRNVGIIHTR